MPELTNVSVSSMYTTVDLNATGTTTLFNPSTDTYISGVYLKNGGSTAAVDLEVTDGTDTATLANNGGGGDIAFSEGAYVGEGDALQANVVTAEGAAQSNTAVVFYAEP